MPTEVQTVRGHQIIIASPQGPIVDPADARALLRSVETASKSLPDYKVVLDLRGANSTMTVYHYWQLSVELTGFRHVLPDKTAVVCNSDQLDLAQFFAQAAHFHGFTCQAFTTLGEANAWLVAPVSAG